MGKALPRLTPEQQKLAEQHAALPEIAVRSYFRKLGIRSRMPQGIDLDDCIGNANLEFLKIVQRWDRRRTGTGNFTAFALARLKYATIDYLRANGRWRRNQDRETFDRLRPTLVSWEDTMRDEDGAMIPTESVMREEDLDPGHEPELVGWAFINACMEKLTEREQVVIWHHYVDGMTLREIGEELGVSESRVSQIETKAMQRLRRDHDIILAATR